jgi:SAM-dependent methyltransferase
MTVPEPMADEFDTMPVWTADAVEAVGPEAAVPAGCRGSGTPEALRWLAAGMGLAAGMRLLDSGAGVGGPSELVARERGVSPVLVDPMVGACRAAARLFGRPVAAAAGERLPFAAGTFDAAWSIGVLCTVPDKRPVLAELRRVVRDGSPVGLLVFVRGGRTLPERPEGNHFPALDELTGLLDDAGLRVEDRAVLADFPEPPPPWQDLVDRVDAVVERDHGHDERFRTAQQQQESIGRLLGDGLVTGHLVVCRTERARSTA